MSSFPATTIKVTGIEPCGATKVCIMMEMVVDVHRLTDISGELMRTAVQQLKTESAKKKK